MNAKLSEILIELEQGKISADQAEERILELFDDNTTPFEHWQKDRYGNVIKESEVDESFDDRDIREF